MFVKDELLKNKNIDSEAPSTEESIKEQSKKYNSDFLFNGTINVNNPSYNNPPYNNSPSNNPPSNNQYIDPLIDTSINNNSFLPPVIYDPIENYDRMKLYDPLVDPRGRSSADQIPTPQVAAQLNFPTQGILDRYHRIGLLVAIDHDNNHNNHNNHNRKNKSYEDFGNVEKIVKGNKVNIQMFLILIIQVIKVIYQNIVIIHLIYKLYLLQIMIIILKIK